MKQLRRTAQHKHSFVHHVSSQRYCLPNMMPYLHTHMRSTHAMHEMHWCAHTVFNALHVRLVPPGSCPHAGVCCCCCATNAFLSCRPTWTGHCTQLLQFHKPQLSSSSSGRHGLQSSILCCMLRPCSCKHAWPICLRQLTALCTLPSKPSVCCRAR